MSKDAPFYDDLTAKVDVAVSAAPTQSDAGSLRSDLVTIDRHDGEYERADQLLVQLKKLINRLRAAPNIEKAVLDDYESKLAGYAFQLPNLLPISDAGYATKYDALVIDVEADIESILALLAKEENARGSAPKGSPSMLASPAPQAMATTIPPLDEPIDQQDADKAGDRLRYFQWAGYAVALILLGLAGYNELYVTKATFGANPWADYATLFAWGFGAEATRAAVTDVVRSWDIPFGEAE